MADDQFRLERLTAEHDRSTFSCGVAALDRYFREQAGQDARRRVAAVYVLVDVASGEVAGYYTLSAASIASASLPPEMTRRLPRYRELPVVLLGRLAVATRYRGQGLGELLLGDAARRVRLQEDIAAMAVVVDAKDDAARAFYERHGFRRLLDDEYRLILPIGPTGTSPARGR